MLTQQLAPEPNLRAALRVVFVAAYTTRNWTCGDDVPRKQINDVWRRFTKYQIGDSLGR